MLKKIPFKNILIVITALLVVPVMAYAFTTGGNPSAGPEDQSREITITSDSENPEKGVESATNATSILNSNAQGVPDAASSATVVSGGAGEDDERYSDEDDDDEAEDHDVIKDDDDEEEGDD